MRSRLCHRSQPSPDLTSSRKPSLMAAPPPTVVPAPAQVNHMIALISHLSSLEQHRGPQTPADARITAG